jgi:hypothetical protein
MSYTYLLESGEESSAECFSGIDPSVRSRLTHTAKMSCCNANGMESFHRSLFGEISENLTEDLGEELPMSFVVDSHAPTFPVQVKARESKEKKADFGVKWRESLAKFDPNSYLWKTHQCSLFEDLTESLQTFPSWGSTHDGELFPLKTPVVLKNAKDFGFWRNSNLGKPPSEPTMDGSANGAEARSCPNADATTANWNALIAESSPTRFIMRNGTIANGAVPEMWLTPQANEDAAGTPNGKMQRMLGNHPLIRGTTQEEWDSGTLNPEWTEWLNGLPIGWTGIEPLGTANYRRWLLSHGLSWKGEN